MIGVFVSVTVPLSLIDNGSLEGFSAWSLLQQYGGCFLVIPFLEGLVFDCIYILPIDPIDSEASPFNIYHISYLIIHCSYSIRNRAFEPGQGSSSVK